MIWFGKAPSKEYFRLRDEWEALGNRISDIKTRTANRERFIRSFYHLEDPTRRWGDLAHERYVTEENERLEPLRTRLSYWVLGVLCVIVLVLVAILHAPWGVYPTVVCAFAVWLPVLHLPARYRRLIEEDRKELEALLPKLAELEKQMREAR